MLGCGLILPSGDYNPAIINNIENERAKQEDINDSMWRLVLFFPLIINGLALLSYKLFIKEDSIMFNLSRGEDVAALRLIEKVYDVGSSSDQDAKEILAYLKQ